MNTETIDVKKSFKKIVRSANEVYNKNGDEYYKLEEHFTGALREFLRHDLSTLSKNDILILCQLVYRHNAMPQHSFLMKLGSMAKGCPSHK